MIDLSLTKNVKKFDIMALPTLSAGQGIKNGYRNGFLGFPGVIS